MLLRLLGSLRHPAVLVMSSLKIKAKVVHVHLLIYNPFIIHKVFRSVERQLNSFEDIQFPKIKLNELSGTVNEHEQ